ncbi:MAG: group I truncated hemoglobin [Burkholderiaceae bacterium]
MTFPAPRSRKTIALAALLLLLTCTGARSAENATQRSLQERSADALSLYERVGGGTIIAAISSDLVERAAADPRTKRSWRKVNLTRVKGVLSEHLCSVTDGPCTYGGDTMEDIHAGLDITEAEMFALVEILRDIMIEREIRVRERNELLALLAPMKRDVVTR